MAAWLSSDLIARFGRLVEVQAWDLWLQDRGFVAEQHTNQIRSV